jgi:CheY-like chemotaxis protein
LNVDEANGGKQAIELLKAARGAGHAYRLVLLDAQMAEVNGFEVAELIQEQPDLAGAVIVMLTPGTPRSSTTPRNQLGIHAYLSKPIKRADLLETVRQVLIGEQVRTDSSTALTMPAETRRRWKILLAEDNLVNQKVAVRFLEKRGHTVFVAHSGTQALAAWRAQTFDLILMDVQMPEMDGFETTAAIREHEKAAGDHIPIIAMTAHALAGDRDRCLAVGMDDYVSKPITTANLFAAIERAMTLPKPSLADKAYQATSG